MEQGNQNKIYFIATENNALKYLQFTDVLEKFFENLRKTNASI